MSAPFQTFIDRLHSAADFGGLGGAVAALGQAFGMTQFAYVAYRNREPDLPPPITTYPEAWIGRYMDCGYGTIDPVLSRARDTPSPFFWEGRNPDRPASAAQRQLFDEAIEFGIACGYTVPIHAGAEVAAMLTFTSEEKPRVMRTTLAMDGTILHLAALYFHVHAIGKRCSAGGVERGVLEAGEIACLQWIARGKSPWDVGEILGIPARNVLSHLKDAKCKLDAATLSQAVATALRRRLIQI
jgi:LuxR family transcriptional regulator, activator of conjugal transfer of Ti plasmids